MAGYRQAAKKAGSLKKPIMAKGRTMAQAAARGAAAGKKAMGKKVAKKRTM